MKGSRRDDRNSDCHRGRIKAAIQKVFADRLFILTVFGKMGKFISERIVGA